MTKTNKSITDLLSINPFPTQTVYMLHADDGTMIGLYATFDAAADAGEVAGVIGLISEHKVERGNNSRPSTV